MRLLWRPFRVTRLPVQAEVGGLLSSLPVSLNDSLYGGSATARPVTF
jgi:hypothetical protein